MKLEDQVCSLELAKKLKELEIEQDSHFYWWVNEETGEIACMTPKPTAFNLVGVEDRLSIYSAFTVAELGEMLPRYLNEPGVKFGFKKKLHIWSDLRTIDYIREFNTGGSEATIPICGKTEADVRAKMIIFLLENKIPLDIK
ncbi:MAG: hypothetical protein WBO32_01080 [Cyclobacteriaceae bacterium]